MIVHWHGLNDDGYHGVALQRMVYEYLQDLPVGTLINASELEVSIQRAVDENIVHQKDPAEYDRDLRYEQSYEPECSGVEYMIEAYYTNKHHYNHPYELVEKVSEHVYRRIEAPVLAS